MKISDKGLAIIKKFEGCQLKAYKCPAGVWTIGYGHTGSDVKSGMTITKTQAIELLKKDVAKFEKAVEKYNSVYDWNQNQFDAMVSFAFNVGSINQLTNNGKRTILEISAKITAYNKAGGRVLAGLTKRRAEEKKLFDTKVISTAKTTVSNTSTTTKASDVKMTSIKKGSKGKAVKVWQIIIGAKPDGDFGEDTRKKTIAFQKKVFPNDKDQWDGIVGDKTWKAGLGSI